MPLKKGLSEIRHVTFDGRTEATMKDQKDQIPEVLFGIVWAIVTVLFVVFVLGLDFEQPDYFIQVVR